LRGWRSKIPISPIKSPGPSDAIFWPSLTTSAVPYSIAISSVE
jgi:hypothetical protein